MRARPADVETVATPTLTPGGFSGPDHDINVRFNCATVGAQIIYNIGSNGNVPPDPTAADHDGVINNNQHISIHLGHKVIKARAIMAGMNDSNVTEGDYEYDNGN